MSQDTRPHSDQTDRTLPVRLIVAAAVGLAILALVLQNAQTVSIDVLLWQVETRLIWALLAVALLGFLAGLILPRFRR